MFPGGLAGPGRAGSGRVARTSFVISVFPLGIPVVNETLFLYIYHYKIPRVAREQVIQGVPNTQRKEDAPMSTRISVQARSFVFAVVALNPRGTGIASAVRT